MTWMKLSIADHAVVGDETFSKSLNNKNISVIRIMTLLG